MLTLPPPITLESELRKHFTKDCFKANNGDLLEAAMNADVSAELLDYICNLEDDPNFFYYCIGDVLPMKNF